MYDDGEFDVSDGAGEPLRRRSDAFTFVTLSLKTTVICVRLVTRLFVAGLTETTVGGSVSATPAVRSGLAKKSTSLELTLKTCTAMTFVPRRRALVKALICRAMVKNTAPAALPL